MAVAAICLSSACSKHRFRKSPWLVTDADTARYLEEALEHHNADNRRNAVVGISKTRYADNDVVVAACSTVARTDGSPSVRAVAIRLIAESRHPEVAQTLLDILDQKTTPTAGERVRIEAINALYYLARNDAVPDDGAETVALAAQRLLQNDESRDVRIAAARLVGLFPRPDALEALVAALHDPDFGVVYQVERSLMHLTGVARNHDARAWRRWLDETDTPFAMMGQLDHRLEPAGQERWWRRLAASVKRVLSGFRSKKTIEGS